MVHAASLLSCTPPRQQALVHYLIYAQLDKELILGRPCWKGVAHADGREQLRFSAILP